MSRRVLIVDDNEDVRRILGLRLQHAGIDVEEAADGLEGLKAVESVKLDLVLLDLVMPRMDGFKFLERLRSSHGSAPRVVVVTQYDDVESRQRALSLGASEYVSKGYAFERGFVGNVRRWLGEGATHHEIGA